MSLRTTLYPEGISEAIEGAMQCHSLQHARSRAVQKPVLCCTTTWLWSHTHAHLELPHHPRGHPMDRLRFLDVREYVMIQDEIK